MSGRDCAAYMALNVKSHDCQSSEAFADARGTKQAYLVKNVHPIVAQGRKLTHRLGQPLGRIAPHVVSVTVWAGVFLALRVWLPPSQPASEFENSVQLLAQILALAVGVLLIGTTVSLSGYEGADTLASIHGELAGATEAFFQYFFAGGRARHKLSRREFRSALLAKPGVDRLLFEELKDNSGWYIYRPHWDGAWYQVSHSPFVESGRTTQQLTQVQVLHEAVICAELVLKAVLRFRSSGSALLGLNRGTNGTRWFLEAFEEYRNKPGLGLPAEMPSQDAFKKVSLAFNSEHYMREEFSEHGENIDWDPHSLTTFQLAYIDYVQNLIHLTAKLQSLRWATICERRPSIDVVLVEKVDALLWWPGLNEAKNTLAALRRRTVAAHGAAAYFRSIKKFSVPGIGIALLVLVALLVGWPFLKWGADAHTRTLGFAVLYAAGVASLFESSIFLGRLLWKRRPTA